MQLESVLLGLCAEYAGDSDPANHAHLIDMRRAIDPQYGDITLKMPLNLSRMHSALNALTLANELTETIKSWPMIARAEIAAPGFINLTVNETALLQQFQRMLQNYPRYGRGDPALPLQSPQHFNDLCQSRCKWDDLDKDNPFFSTHYLLSRATSLKRQADMMENMQMISPDLQVLLLPELSPLIRSLCLSPWLLQRAFAGMNTQRIARHLWHIARDFDELWSAHRWTKSAQPVIMRFLSQAEPARSLAYLQLWRCAAHYVDYTLYHLGFTPSTSFAFLKIDDGFLPREG